MVHCQPRRENVILLHCHFLNFPRFFFEFFRKCDQKEKVIVKIFRPQLKHVTLLIIFLRLKMLKYFTNLKYCIIEKMHLFDASSN